VTLTSEKTVLVVDDDDDARDVIAACLEEAGHTVEVASHGQEALERLRDGLRPALVVLDLMMPVMDGWTLLGRLSQDPTLSAIPVIVMSAGGELALHSVNAAAQLSKPVDPAALVALVSTLSPPGR
jgi:CheY-like chemotaxis protein